MGGLRGFILIRNKDQAFKEPCMMMGYTPTHPPESYVIYMSVPCGRGDAGAAVKFKDLGYICSPHVCRESVRNTCVYIRMCIYVYVCAPSLNPNPKPYAHASQSLYSKPGTLYIGLYIWESLKKPGVLKWRKQKDVPEEKKLVWVEVGTLYGH